MGGWNGEWMDWWLGGMVDRWVGEWVDWLVGELVSG